MRLVVLIYALFATCCLLTNVHALLGTLAVAVGGAALGIGIGCLLFCDKGGKDVDSKPPKFTFCPGDIRVTSERGQRGAVVTWDTPRAKDDRGKARLIPQGWSSGSFFHSSLHPYTIRYSAIDDSGNMVPAKKECSFTVVVEELVCENIEVRKGYLNCGNNGLIYGTQCRIVCFPGNELVGNDISTCESNEQWTPSIGSCERIQCPELKAPEHGNFAHCDEMRCSFTCNDGYSIRRGDSSLLMCMSDGQWSGFEPTCEDTQVPVIHCPENVRTYVEKGLGSAVVDWSTPNASDNTGIRTLQKTEGPDPRTRLVANSYYVMYEATDYSQNTATCSFMITVADVECDLTVLFPDTTQHITCSDLNKLGSVCEYVCTRGYEMEGGKRAVYALECLQSNESPDEGEWNATKPTCIPVECEQLDAPSNGSLVSCGIVHGDFCSIECDEGFEVRGVASLRCVDGSWDRMPASCEALTCAPPYIPYKSYILNNDTCDTSGTAAIDTVCGYGCKAGHFLAGNAYLRCDEAGRWFPMTPPTCNVITCDSNKVPAPVNGYRSGCFHRDVITGSSCTLGCNYGFLGQPSRTLRVTCVEDKDNPGGRGVWDTDSSLTCDPVSCVPFTRPRNGRISECRKGNLTMNVNSTQSYGSICTAECDDGYTPYGTSTRSCTITGDWDGTNLTCRDDTPPKVQCPGPRIQIAEPLANHVTMDPEWEPVNVVDASLPWVSFLKMINFKPVNSSRISRIFEEGEYLMHYSVEDRLGNEALCSFDYTVKVLRCPPLYAPQYGVLEIVEGDGTCSNAVRGSVCRLTCEEGYHFSNDEDENDFTCVVDDSQLSRGHWNGTQVQCEPNVCIVPSVPNGYKSGCFTPKVGYRTQCQFACNVGFQSPGTGISSVRRTCQADSSWSGQDLVCKAVACPGGFHIQDGFVDPPVCSTNETVDYNTVCRFSCKSGYQQNGPFSKRCGRDGHWEGESRNTTCIDKEPPRFRTTCPLYVQTFAEQDTATVWYDTINATDNAGDDQVTISRLPEDSPENGGSFGEGYHIVSYTAQDREGNVAKCNVYISVLVLRCPVLSSPISGSVSCSGRAKGSTCVFTCDEGYEINGRSHILTCSGEGSTALWDYEPPTCTHVQCPPLPDPPIAIKSGCNRRYYRDVCLWACPYGYQSKGSPKSVCQANQTWSDDSFTCEEQSCPSISFASGLIVTPPGCGQDPIFEDTCHVKCAKRRYHVFPRTHSYMRCRGDGTWTYNASEIECRDEEPPRLACPLHFIAYTERGEYSALVTWNVTVEDNSDEDIVAVCNRNETFYPEGSYDVLCMARDESGNVGSCSFEFHVRVRYCPPFILPASGAFKGECSSHYGGICEISCIEGYELQGSPIITCERVNGLMAWRPEQVPRCAVSSCPPIPADIIPDDVGIFPALCQDKKPPLFGLECSFYCKKYGFRPVGYLHPIICQSDGSWNVDLHTISIRCEDVIPPDVFNCPSNMFATLREGNTEVEVHFEEPHAEDNSELEPIVIRSPRNVSSPFRVSESTIVSYEFCDSFNNSRLCSFHIEVQNDLPPEVVSCPDDIEVEATGRETIVTWEDPVFSEPLGDNDALRQWCNYNSGETLPWGSHNIVCTAENSKNNRVARCVFVAEVRPADCPPLQAPQNGALACDEWVYGHFCNQQCNDQYDVPPGAYQPYFICGVTGQWIPPFVRDCTIPRRTDSFRLSSAIQYFSGDCRDPETQRSIKQAFIEMLDDQQQLSEICSGSSECTIDNVSVKCGTTRSGRGRGRGKRHISSKTGHNNGLSANLIYKDFLLKQMAEDFMKENQKQTRLTKLRQDRNNVRNRPKAMEQLHRRRRRSIDDYVITLSFNLVANLNVTENSTDYEYEDEAYYTLVSLYDAAGALEEETLAGNLVPEVAGLDLGINQNASYSYDEPVPVCDPGYGIVWETYKCAACVAGTYFDEEYSDCVDCPIGEYQDAEAQTACKKCPLGTTTEHEGSQSIDDCLPYCIPGEYSGTGLAPCAKCEIGDYQSLEQQTFCDSCPPGYTTLTNGSSSYTQCIELCPPGYWSSDGFQPCQPCTVRYFQPNYGQSGCLPCPGIKTTNGEGASSEDDCNIDAMCAPDDCLNGASCQSFIDGPRCKCAAGFTGDRCETNIPDCTETSCANGGTCLDLVNSYACICQDGYEGDDCSNDIDECASSPCIHALSCVDLIADFACICMEGYTNKTCNEEIRPCESQPCLNGGTCQSILNQFNCTCPPGYIGDYCEVDLLECQSHPCLNGGTCHDLVNGFWCQCINGYSGVTCAEDDDLCDPHPCYNGGLCVEEDGNYTCLCPVDKAGFHCERDATPCDRKPCINGTCHEIDRTDSETGLDYQCECNVGFSGINCDVPLSQCESLPCSNRGTCEDTIDGYVCHCPASFSGEHCEEIYDHCRDQPCENSGICVQDEMSFFCICAPEFTGGRCEEHVLLCHDDFCQNGGYCAPTNSSDVCVCPTGFKGVACEEEINMCESQPCLNNGNCIQENSSFSCYCQGGYTGDLCDVDIDECWVEPCIHGNCIDKVNDYSCDCFVGFEGKKCEIDINDCVDHGCVHGDCVDGNATYSCSCESGYRGRYCQEEINECASNPCFHSSGCIDQVNAYQCVCENGWTGNRCESNIDDCPLDEHGACYNDGTCVDQLNDFMCLCLPGFSGKRCDININECESIPCENGGTCHDGNDAYTCSCPRGWDGDNCQIMTSICQPNPCRNGGICNITDNEGGYTCQCQPGLEGQHCELDVDDCVDNDCVGEATCMDLVNGYRCICPPGFSGDTCSIEDDPCEATPCLNNGTCILTQDEDAKVPCLCPTGYEGQYCERNVDDCIPNPCLHEGECIDGLNTFTCNCQPGLSGERCEEDIDECQNHSCEEIGTERCQDALNGYTCKCRHGFKGRYCTERISSDFDVVFPRHSINPKIKFKAPTRQFQDLTISLWVRSENQGGYIFSSEIETGGGVYVFIDEVLKVHFFGTEIDTAAIITGTRWHHIAVSYNHITSIVAAYVDGGDVTTRELPQQITFPRSKWTITLGNIIGPQVLDLRQFEGRISGVNVWNEFKTASEISALSEMCYVEIPGSLLILADFRWAVFANVNFEEPSTCEAFDDCASNPCNNSATCVDRYQHFKCLCPKGLEGTTCSENPNDCKENSCLNGGTCIDDYDDFTCMCPSAYTGEFCELNIVHGGWSEWSEWSQCTETCGGGTQTASRICNSPRPQNGGAGCGDPTQGVRMQECNTHPCPHCKEFKGPRNGFAQFISDISSRWVLKYQIFCNEGFDFCRQPFYEYVCGPDTGYLWTHEAANPKLRVPGCTKQNNVRGVQVSMSGKYSGGICQDSDDMKQDTLVKKINQVTASNGQRQKCVRNGKCKLSIDTKRCSERNSGRYRREAEETEEVEEAEAPSATVTMKFTQLVNDSILEYLDHATADNVTDAITASIGEAFNDTITEMTEVFSNIVTSVQSGLFRISSGGELHDMELFEAQTKFVCEEGSVWKANTTLCVSCEPGTYQSGDQCIPCDFGTYQPAEGKTRCRVCPNEDSVTWTGIAAVEMTECFAPSNVS